MKSIRVRLSLGVQQFRLLCAALDSHEALLANSDRRASIHEIAESEKLSRKLLDAYHAALERGRKNAKK